MPLFLVCFLYIFSMLESMQCYTYQTKPLFLSFSELAALEATSLHPDSRFRDDVEKPLVVNCLEDGIEVVMKAPLFQSMEAKHWRLGPVGAGSHHCRATGSGDGGFTIRAGLTDCGGQMTFTHRALLYNNWLQAEGVAIPVQCEYRRRYTVSSRALKPTWSPPISVQTPSLHLDFGLRLMTDDWSSERKSFVYFPGDLVNMEASVNHHHLPLRLFVNSCVATLTPDVNSYPRYPFIDHQGCFTDSQLDGSRSRFLPRVQDQLLHIQLEPFLFHQETRLTVYITCSLEAEPVLNKELVKKACSFINGRWRSVDGDDSVCGGCGNTRSTHKRALRARTRQRQTDFHRDASLGPVIFLHRYKHPY